jgi:hypothetical protein
VNLKLTMVPVSGATMDDGMVRGGGSDLHQAIWEIIAQWEQESRN